MSSLHLAIRVAPLPPRSGESGASCLQLWDVARQVSGRDHQSV